MIALISDIHGNYPALTAVLEEIDKLSINQIYCLGDIVGYYAQINECCEELQKRNIKCVLGNHDWYMISKTNCQRSKSANDCLKYQSKIITSQNLEWLEQLPLILQINELSMVHAGWNNPLDEYLSDVDPNYFNFIEGNYFASGHTHVPSIRYFGAKVYCNPGSVGQPRDGNHKAAFAIFNGIDFQIHRVGYDIELTCRKMHEAGFDEYYYKRLTVGSRDFFK